jgi:hypothetical protein
MEPNLFDRPTAVVARTTKVINKLFLSIDLQGAARTTKIMHLTPRRMGPPQIACSTHKNNRDNF